jgi:hypothetical protein
MIGARSEPVSPVPAREALPVTPWTNPLDEVLVRVPGVELGEFRALLLVNGKQASEPFGDVGLACPRWTLKQ